jgi:hypothetical protein
MQNDKRGLMENQDGERAGNESYDEPASVQGGLGMLQCV